MILAGDIGGTNARLAFFEATNGSLRLVTSSVFPSRDYATLDEIVVKFVDTSSIRPDAACFGIAGPVQQNHVKASNLPWLIDGERLAKEIKLRHAVLINDLEANAWGIAGLEPKDVVPLNKVDGAPVGNQAVIAAGTGLGEAGMYWDGKQFHIFACEGGHTDFAPRNALEIELLGYLEARYEHVSYERVVSGPGLVNIFDFLRDTKRGTVPAPLAAEVEHGGAAAISKAAMGCTAQICVDALDLFISVYAAEAGNLALKLMATGGIYLGGGISPKILSKLQGPAFMQNFLSKGRMQRLLESIPVRVIMNDQTALLGAARCAAAKAT
ncbi:MAG TPA: glucokinase [Terriglobales bacterium]|nr:glucokinase [Terriglobales bacterium]